MGIIKSIKNYFRKRKDRKKYIEYRKVFFETTQRECQCFEASIMNGIGYCNYNKNAGQYHRCNPERCRYIIAKMAEFEKEWKNMAK